MTAKPKTPPILDAAADKVLAYRPSGKGQAALKARKKIERAEKKASRE